MSICSDSQGAKEGDCDCPCEKYLGSFHVPLLAQHRIDEISVSMPRYKAPAWSLLPLSVPEVRRLLWQLFGSGYQLKLIFGLVLLAATTSSC